MSVSLIHPAREVAEVPAAHTPDFLRFARSWAVLARRLDLLFVLAVRELGLGVLIGWQHVLGTISLTCGEGGSYGASRPRRDPDHPLIVIVAGCAGSNCASSGAEAARAKAGAADRTQPDQAMFCNRESPQELRARAHGVMPSTASALASRPASS